MKKDWLQKEKRTKYIKETQRVSHKTFQSDRVVHFSLKFFVFFLCGKLTK